jgi:hypothetical protein
MKEMRLHGEQAYYSMFLLAREKVKKRVPNDLNLKKIKIL